MRTDGTARQLLGAFAVMAFGLAACGGDDDEGADGGSGQGSEEPSEFVEDADITWVITSDPGNLDPQLSPTNVNVQLAPLAYDPLVHRNEDGDIVSGLAESWEDNGLEGLTFTLREGITCSDGSELTASDVAANFEYAGNPENGSFHLGAAVPQSPEVTADDEAGTVTIVPQEPFPFFLTAVTIFPIVCPAGVDDRELLADATYGTGPYELSDITPGEAWTYTKRDDYAWGPDASTMDEPGHPGTITFQIVDNETTVTNQLLAGDVDIAEVVGPERERLEDEGLFNETYLLGVAQMFFNELEGRLSAEEHVRRAVTMGVNLDELSEVVTGGFGQVGQGLTYSDPRICPADTVTEHLPPFDPEGARELLEENGWTEGSGGIYEKDGQPLSIELSHLTDVPGFGVGAELMAEQLRGIGVDLTLNPGTSESLSEVVFGSGNWDIVWVPVSRELPVQLTPIFQGPPPPEGGLNWSYISNPDYDELVEKAAAQLDESGCPDWEAAEVALIERVDVVPFAESRTPVFGSSRVRFEVGPLGIVSPMSVRVVAE